MPYLLHPSREHELHEAWRPVTCFLGDDPASTLMEAVPAEVRRTHIEEVIDRLPERTIFEHEADLEILFSTLFEDGAAQALTPLHRKALRAVADLVDAHPGLVNHGEVIRRHDLPWDSFQLRELASAAPASGSGSSSDADS